MKSFLIVGILIICFTKETMAQKTAATIKTTAKTTIQRSNFNIKQGSTSSSARPAFAKSKAGIAGGGDKEVPADSRSKRRTSYYTGVAAENKKTANP